MTRARRILLVEDHRDTVAFLTSLLQMAQSGHQIITVPSAEEGILEIQQGAFELLLTAQELPGMDGMELARQAQRYRPGTRTVIISGQAGRPRPEDLELAAVRHYFNKPLDSAAFLEVIAGLLGPAPGSSGRAQKAIPAALGASGEPATIERRLEQLRNDTGALQVLVADRSGAVLFAQGGNDSSLDRAALAALLARGLAHGDGVSLMLQAATPVGIHYYLGRQQDVFCANIDESHFLVIVMAAGRRRGVIGSLWVYGQKAAGDLRAALQEMAPRPAASHVAPPPTETIPLAAPPPQARPAQTAARAGESAGRAGASPAETAAPPAAAPPVPAEEETLSHFWEEAAGGVSEDTLFPRRFSLEEARKHGLIPPEFAPDDDS
jgi:CheY-like chemotaxis protein